MIELRKKHRKTIKFLGKFPEKSSKYMKFLIFFSMILWLSIFFYPGLPNDHGFRLIFHFLLYFEKSGQKFHIFEIFLWIFGLFSWILTKILIVFPRLFLVSITFFSIFFSIFLWYSNFFYPGWSNDRGFRCIFLFYCIWKKVWKFW